jgi:hypothetical protein
LSSSPPSPWTPTDAPTSSPASALAGSGSAGSTWKIAFSIRISLTSLGTLLPKLVQAKRDPGMASGSFGDVGFPFASSQTGVELAATSGEAGSEA